MSTDQANITDTVAQIAAEAARVMVQAMDMASAENKQRLQNVGPEIGGPLMRQPTFNWGSIDKCADLRNFRIQAKNMFQNYNINQSERVPIIKNWLGRQGLQLLETLTQAAEEACHDEEGLFGTLGYRFKPQNNETIKITSILHISQAT